MIVEWNDSMAALTLKITTYATFIVIKEPKIVFDSAFVFRDWNVVPIMSFQAISAFTTCFTAANCM